MRTQIAKTEYLPTEYIPPTFLTRTPSPFCAGSSWGLLSRKIFFDFYFSDFARNLSEVWIEIIFLIFRLRFLLVFYFFYFFRFSFGFLFRLCFFRLSYLIISTRLKFVILYSILFRISVVLTHYKFYLDILLVYIRSILSLLRFQTSIMIFDSYFYLLDSFFLASISICFSIVYSTL